MWFPFGPGVDRDARRLQRERRLQEAEHTIRLAGVAEAMAERLNELHRIAVRASAEARKR